MVCYGIFWSGQLPCSHIYEYGIVLCLPLTKFVLLSLRFKEPSNFEE